MTKQLHFCIHGAGGLGSLIGGLLARAGDRVTLIARRPHVEAVRSNGLNIDGTRGSFTARDNVAAVERPDEVEGDIDYYILLTKSKGTAQALSDAAALGDRIACALSLQNGIGKEERLREAFGAERVIGGSTVEGATLVAPGSVISHLAVPVTAYFGELGGGESERTRVIAQAFANAGLGARSTRDIEHVLWEKLVQVGGASAWGASSLGGIASLDFADGLGIRAGAEHYVTIYKELLAVYRAIGYAPQNFYAPVSRLREVEAASFEEAVEDAMALGARFAAGKRPIRTSMHDDLIASRRMEVEEILGPLATAAARFDVSAPTFLGAYRVLTTLNAHL